jgi:hypothetical protein
MAVGVAEGNSGSAIGMTVLNRDLLDDLAMPLPISSLCWRDRRLVLIYSSLLDLFCRLYSLVAPFDNRYPWKCQSAAPQRSCKACSRVLMPPQFSLHSHQQRFYWFNDFKRGALVPSLSMSLHCSPALTQSVTFALVRSKQSR